MVSVFTRLFTCQMFTLFILDLFNNTNHIYKTWACLPVITSINMTLLSTLTNFQTANTQWNICIHAWISINVQLVALQFCTLHSNVFTQYPVHLHRWTFFILKIKKNKITMNLLSDSPNSSWKIAWWEVPNNEFND